MIKDLLSYSAPRVRSNLKGQTVVKRHAAGHCTGSMNYARIYEKQMLWNATAVDMQQASHWLVGMSSLMLIYTDIFFLNEYTLI